MIKFTWNNVEFSITDLGGGKLGESIPRHAHAKNCYELHFITNGKGTLKTDEKTFYLKRNDFFITGPNVYHSQNFNKSSPVEDVFILIQAQNTNKANTTSKVFLENHFCFFENIDNSIAKNILKEYKEKAPDYQSAIAGMMMQVLTDTVRLFLPNDFVDLNNNDNLNDKRFAIIEQAFLYEKNLTLSKLSQMIGLCDRQTQRLLKKYYNKSFREIKKEIKKKN